MTNQQQEPFAPAPPGGYWKLYLPSAAKRAKAQNDGENRAVDEFIETVNRTADLIAPLNPNRAMRAEGYRNKPATLWAEQFLSFPKDAAEDWADWERVGPGDENLRDEIVSQVEAILAEAGVDFEVDTQDTANAKLEAHLAATAAPVRGTSQSAPPAASPRNLGNGDTGRGGGPAYT